MSQLKSLQLRITQSSIHHWLYSELFTWQWWFLIGCFVVAWLLAWVLIDRKRLLELCVFFLITSYLVSTLDAIGTQFGFWMYNFHEVPLLNRLVSVDLGALPVLYTLFYQFFNRWLIYLGVLVAAAFVFSFIFEPLFQRINILVYYNWQSLFSFPIYILIGIIIKAVMIWIIKINKRANLN